MPHDSYQTDRIRRLVLAVACAVSALAFVMAQAAQATNSQLRYVALGDSYSAASGVVPPDPMTAMSSSARSSTAAPPGCRPWVKAVPARIGTDRRLTTP